MTGLTAFLQFWPITYSAKIQCTTNMENQYQMVKHGSNLRKLHYICISQCKCWLILLI